MATQPVLAVGSSMVKVFTMNPAGGEPNSDYCDQAEVNLDFGTLLFWSKAEVYVNPTTGCNDTANSLPASWLGVKVRAMMDGAICDSSVWAYNGTAADHLYRSWMLCTNPSGDQNWRAVAWVAGYDGASTYTRAEGPTSPIFTY